MTRILFNAGELYESGEESSGDLKECSGFEDPVCADCWTIHQTRMSDHYTYLGISMDCEESNEVSFSKWLVFTVYFDR